MPNNKKILARKMLYIDDSFAPIRGKDQLMNDIQLPFFMNEFLRLNKIGLTIWESFKRRPKFNKKERLVCLMHGNERVRMVSAIFK